MHKLKFKLGIILLLITVGCQSEESDVESMLEATPYFDLKGVINQQITLLDRLNPQVEITASIGKNTETETMQKDSAAWAEALQLYVDADLNKPVLRGQYTITDSTLEEENLQAKIYRAKNEKEAEIPYMKVVYKDSTSNPCYVETLFREENLLYSTYRSMSLHFDQLQGNLRLTEYETQGRQKMVFKDSVFYSTRGLLQY
ncbi:hypothetical protein WJR50_07560 [Catalinimonas sp. 4WD22]|uniref:hypothetical protein n=1 Tax=Catalinimonas locisalis TaxID=3133978 RepID=UPI0031011D5B